MPHGGREPEDGRPGYDPDLIGPGPRRQESTDRKINVHGNLGTYIEKPKHTLIREFQNNFMTGDSERDEVNAKLKDLVEMLLDSKDLSEEDKEQAVEAVHVVAEQVKEGKAPKLTVKGTLEQVRQIVSRAADIAVPASTIIASILKLIGA